MAVERSLVLIKPDAMARNLQGTVINELSSLDIDMIGLKLVEVSKDLALTHYDELKEESFFSTLISYIRGQYHGKNRVIAIAYQGDDAISKIRNALGATNPDDAEFNTIRGRYGRVRAVGDINLIENIAHASSSADDGERETNLWFDTDELINS